MLNSTEDFEAIKFLIEHINDQSKFQFDKIVTLFIFFCTLNLTAILSGYLTILNANKESLDLNRTLKSKLVDRGSIAFMVASVLGIIGTAITCFYFKEQESKVINAFSSLKQEFKWIDIASISDQYMNYIVVSVLFIGAKLGFIWLWILIRRQNKAVNQPSIK